MPSISTLSPPAAIRRVAAATLPTRHTLICDPCEVAWTGQEADCWSCGHPATHTTTPLAALQRLLATVTPAAVTR